MTSRYIEDRDGLLYLAKTRIPLALIDRAFRDGESSETIRANFPSLSLEQVYGAITFCLAEPARLSRYHRDLVKFEAKARKSTPPLPTTLRRKLARRRAAVRTKS